MKPRGRSRTSFADWDTSSDGKCSGIYWPPGFPRAASFLGRYLLAPIGAMPGWLSATVIAAVTGVLMLAAFKYTSNQNAIKRVRQ